MNKEKRNLLLLGGAVLVIAVAAVIGLATFFQPQTTAGEKTISVQVVMAEEDVRDFTVQTQREFLGDALLDETLIEGEGGEYGLFVTAVDGVTADEANQEWWCLTKGGETVNTGFDQTPIADGDQFEITLTIGW